MNLFEWSSYANVSNVTGHDCFYTGSTNWFYETHSYCTFSTFDLRWAGYLLISILLASIIIYIYNKIIRDKKCQK